MPARLICIDVHLILSQMLSWWTKKLILHNNFGIACDLAPSYNEKNTDFEEVNQNFSDGFEVNTMKPRKRDPPPAFFLRHPTSAGDGTVFPSMRIAFDRLYHIGRPIYVLMYPT